MAHSGHAPHSDPSQTEAEKGPLFNWTVSTSLFSWYRCKCKGISRQKGFPGLSNQADEPRGPKGPRGSFFLGAGSPEDRFNIPSEKSTENIALYGSLDVLTPPKIDV